MGSSSLVDKIEIQVLVNNATDSLSTIPAHAESELTAGALAERIDLPLLSTPEQKYNQQAGVKMHQSGRGWFEFRQGESEGDFPRDFPPRPYEELPVFE